MQKKYCFTTPTLIRYFNYAECKYLFSKTSKSTYQQDKFFKMAMSAEIYFHLRELLSIFLRNKKKTQIFVQKGYSNKMLFNPQKK